MINKKILKISFACILSLVTLASCNTNNDDEEWYGLGFEVATNSRSQFLIGEKPTTSMFNFIGYEDGEEVKIDPKDVTIEENKSLTKDDTKLKFKWKNYTTTYDISVLDSLVSDCSLMEKGLFKYTEPEHTLNKKGTEPDPSSEDVNVNQVDSRAAKKETRTDFDGNKFAYLADVSYGSNFSFDFNTDQEGYLYLYASVASNNYSWGQVSEKYKTSINGSSELDLSKVVEVTNNEKAISTSENMYIPSSIVTEKQMDEASSLKSDWEKVLYYSLRKFERKWICKIPLENGMNSIKLNINKSTGKTFSAYQDMACGNWKNIEMKFVTKGEKLNPKSLEVLKQPKQNYLVGEKFSLDGALLFLHTDNNLTEEIDISKVIISNTKGLMPKDKFVEIEYKGVKTSIPVNVTNKVVGNLEEDNSPIKYIEPVHNRDKNNKTENEVGEGFTVDTTSAKIGTKRIENNRYLENVSAYSKFNYSYDAAEQKGKFDIYAYVASNGAKWGDASKIWSNATNGCLGSKAIDFTKFVTLTNNGKEYPLNSDAKIGQTDLDESMDPNILGEYKENESWKSWGTCTYYLFQNFKRIHLGTIDIKNGKNDISINIGYNQGGFGYASSLCGNWDRIEFIYMDEETDLSIKEIKIESMPKTTYTFGEKFSKDNMKLFGYTADNIEIAIDLNDVEIVDDTPLYNDKDVVLRYKGVEFTIPVKVQNTITQNFKKLNDETNVINYIEMSTDDTKKANTIYTKLANEIYIEKVSTTSYFEFVLDIGEDNKVVDLTAEIASNIYVYKNINTDKADNYDPEIPGLYDNASGKKFVGSSDMQINKFVKLTNTVNEKTTEFIADETSVVKGHLLNAEDNEMADKFRVDGVLNNSVSWGFATHACMENFQAIHLGQVKLSKGKNVVRINLFGEEYKNGFSFNGIACGNWKSVTLTIK